MGGGDIVPAMDRGVIDAAEFNNPSSDMALGFPDVAKEYMLQSHHRKECFEIIFNKTKYDALPAELKDPAQGGLCVDRLDNSPDDRYSKDLEEIKKRGVQVIKTPNSVMNAQLDAWDRDHSPS